MPQNDVGGWNEPRAELLGQGILRVEAHGGGRVGFPLRVFIFPKQEFIGSAAMTFKVFKGQNIFFGKKIQQISKSHQRGFSDPS